MALLIHAFSNTGDIPSGQFGNGQDQTDFFTWRGHWDLARWFEILHRLRGQRTENFIAVPVRIDADDLIALEQAIRYGQIAARYPRYVTAGDSSEPADEAEFIQAAREAIDRGHRVYCVSRW